MARRSSSSYKHVFNNNLVSKSPFKSHIPTPVNRSIPRSVATTALASPKGPRRVSGEKRPRPDSMVQQAEAENAQRVRELGFKRRQSKAFQGLVEKEPVTKSPFRRIVSPYNIPDSAAPIAIDLPVHSKLTDEDTTSMEEDENDSVKEKNDQTFDVFSSAATLKPSLSPSRPVTPTFTLPPASPSSPDKRSPLPSALQGSPARSSLIQRSRLHGPRSRSLSGSPADSASKERRKTVTFDERCDVVEFDRESHEEVFTTDDEDIYGPPEDKQDKVRISHYSSLMTNSFCRTLHMNP